MVFLGWIPGLQAQPGQYKFSKLNNTHGLSNNQVTKIFKDKKGFVWIGTMSGLNRFDGYQCKTFRNDKRDPSSINDNYINDIFEDHLGRLWVETRAGMNIYQPHLEAFDHHTLPYLQEMGIQDLSLKAFMEDRGGNYWYLGMNTGVYYFSAKGESKHLGHSPTDSASIASGFVADIGQDFVGNIWLIHKNGILESLDRNTLQVSFRNTSLFEKYKGEFLDYKLMADSDGDLWVYSTNKGLGLYLFNTAQKSFRHFHIGSQEGSLNTDIVSSVIEGKKGIIWVGTDHGGINILNKMDFSIQPVLHDHANDKSISHNSITSLYKDNLGIIWVGTYKQGVNYYHENIFKFDLFRYPVSSAEEYVYNDINAFVEDSAQNFWIGTNGGGLIYFDRENGRYTHYRHDPTNPHSLSNDVIVSLCLDHLQNLWIGTFQGGLNMFDGDTFTRYRNDPNEPESLANDNIWEIFEDSEKNLWVGTLGGGLDLFDRKRETFHHYRSGEVNSVHSDYISSIAEDRSGNLWIGSAYGVDVLEKNSRRFYHYTYQYGYQNSLSNNNVTVVKTDSRGWVWVGTREGLNLFHADQMHFQNFRVEDGLPSNTILAILEDDQHNLWLSTPEGLSNMWLEVSDSSGTPGLTGFGFKNYDGHDGLQGKEFNVKAALRTHKHELVFAGPKGFNLFRPTDIREGTMAADLVFTDLQVFNHSVKAGQKLSGKTILEEAIPYANDIVLTHEENVFSIEFAGLGFIHPEKTRYAYKLEGFNNDWLVTDGTSRKATYTNLDPGKYVFKVKASKSDGSWEQQTASLNIEILPPFWKTKLAFFAYALFFIGLLLGYRKITLERERMKFRIAQERQEAERMHQLDLMKIKFFTNISHEFRTPLSLIIAPVDKMLKKAGGPEQEKQFLMISRNAKRLLALVNQLLDFRKMEIQETQYRPAKTDVIAFIKDVANAFSDLSENKHIHFAIHCQPDQLTMDFDRDKLEKILFNLLSNAFKFTPENGEVSISVTQEKDGDGGWLKIAVKDNGIGIPASKQGKIFERFFQHELPGNFVNQGSGIGLALVKEFVNLHQGEVSVESRPGKGSTFTVQLPITQKSQPTEFAYSESGLGLSAMEGEMEGILADDKENGHPQAMNGGKKKVVLLVEDNEDFRFYLKDNLKAYFRIIDAPNGQLGWEKAISEIPDLVVSDMMMPVMDGLELLTKLKHDQRTSHIPVVLLTAKAAEEQVLKGYQIGADDYMAKPFNFEILLARLKNLIAGRAALQKKFKQQIDIHPKEIEIVSQDEKFINNGVQLVEENIANPDFSVEGLSKELGMSRAHLYKKMVSLTGKSPVEFIRAIRLKRAAQLLEKSQLNVSEVAYQVGFNNPKYFSKYFKAEYGCLPSTYQETRKAGG